jgi:hypothetical protein
MPTEITTTTTKLSIENTGRRCYFRGNTYPVRAQLREAGCRWDREANAWWIGSVAKATEILARLAPQAEAKAAEPEMARWTKNGDAWVVRSTTALEAGQVVKVRKAGGEIQEVTIAEVLDAEDQAEGGRTVWLGTPKRERREATVYEGSFGTKYAWRGERHLGRWPVLGYARGVGYLCAICGSPGCDGTGH